MIGANPIVYFWDFANVLALNLLFESILVDRHLVESRLRLPFPNVMKLFTDVIYEQERLCLVGLSSLI